MKPVVFGGPSIFGLPAALLAAFDIRDPARRGDVLEAAIGGAREIAIIDGFFDQAPSIWHKEILWALSNGAAVAGAASMGALRACECECFGMVGVGRIFEDYRSGLRTADSDVALLHAPKELGYRPLTVALVDVEATLDLLQAGDLIGDAEAELIIRRGAALHFRERSWASILAELPVSPGRRIELSVLISSHLVSQKAADAKTLLELMASGQLPKPISPSRWPLSTTPFLDRLRMSLPDRGSSNRDARS